MSKLFENRKYFTFVFGFILITDILVKLFLETFPYRYVSKPLIMISLIGFYVTNQKEDTKGGYNLMVIALFCFLIGDIFLIAYEINAFYIIGVVLFIVGKLFYVFRFSNQKDFKLLRLIPFFMICFVYMVGLMHFVMGNLGSFLIPILIYIFVSLMVVLFAFLRKNEVDVKSYVLVLTGVVVAIISDSITVLQSFYNPNFPYHKILIMLIYGISQYLIVIGIVEEKKINA